MNPAKWTDTVDCKRLSRSVNASTGRETPSVSTVHSAVRCRVSELPPKELETILGKWSGARFHIQWGTTDMRNNDTVVFESTEYTLQEVRPHRRRIAAPGFTTGILVERANK